MVEVITPIHNDNPHLLERNIHSVKAQTTRCFHIVVDDASEPSLGEQYKQICENFNVVYMRTDHNIGPGLARQYALDNGYNVEYCIFLDADDMLMPYAVKDLQSEANKNNANLVSGDILQEGLSGEDTVITFPRNNTWIHGKLYRVPFLKENNICFHPKLFFNEDAYFNTLMFNISKNNCAVSKIMAIWTSNPNSVTRKNGNIFLENQYVDYFKGNIYALENLYDRKLNTNFGIIFGQIYNAYETEQIYRDDLTPLKQMLNEFVTPKMPIVIKHPEFTEAYIARIKTSRDGILFKDSAQEFLKKVMEGNL